MSTVKRNHAELGLDDRLCWPDAEIAEVALLLPARQTAALERLASARGLTLGQLLRLLIQDYLACHAGAEAARAEPFSPPRRGENGVRSLKGEER